MALQPGTRLGPYEILAPVGAGGMGEVYRARDTRLDRTVAIKVLPAQLSSDQAARLRFEREARAVSALAHPHVCVLHDIGRQDDVSYFVMEYLDGETLAARLQKGPIPLEQALRLGMQILDALDRAHRHGVVHRDLKPANIMLTRTGAKLMDFGLARMSAPPVVAGSSALTTQVKPITAEGSIVGTFQYMAPEQLEGKEADARSDLFAFGAVLYEMVTGRNAFEGKTQASVIAAILEREPPSIVSLQPMTPPALDRVVRNCLMKDPEERWQTAHDLLLELKWIAETGAQAITPVVAPTRRTRSERLAWMLTAALLAASAGLAYAWFHAVGSRAPTVRSYINAPDNTQFSSTGDLAGPVVLAPDSHALAFVATDSEGRNQLWLRQLNSLMPRALPDTDGAMFPFWSPDSRSIGFFADGKLKTIEARGGPPATVCDATNGRGGSWGKDVIVFSPDFRAPMFRVPVSGGTPVQVTRIDASKHTTHRWPVFLPDGERFLYLAARHDSARHEDDGIYLASVQGGGDRLVLHTSANVALAAGHLLFLRDEFLMAQPFDARRGELAGEPVQVADRLLFDPSVWRAAFAASDTILAYQQGDPFGGPAGLTLARVDGTGKPLAQISDKGLFSGPRLSPDGQMLAVNDGDPGDIWVYGLSRGVRTRITFDPEANEVEPVWSPDGRRIAYASGNRPDGRSVIYVKSSTGVGSEEMLLDSAPYVWPTDWSPDGRFLLYIDGDPIRRSRGDIWLLPLAGDRKPIAFLHTPFAEFDATFSPDGRWIAYSSNESGRQEVYVLPSPLSSPTPATIRWQVSTTGGALPRWRRDGKEIFFLAPDNELMVAPVAFAATGAKIGEARPLFPASSRRQRYSYDVLPSGDQFILITSAGDENASPIALVTNWTAALPR